MAKRVVLGNDGSDYGLQISKSGDDVIDDTINTRDLLFTTVDNYRSGVITSDTDVTAMTTSGINLPTTSDGSNNYIPAYQVVEKGVKLPVASFSETVNLQGNQFTPTIIYELEADAKGGLPTVGGGGMFEFTTASSGTTANNVKAVFFDLEKIENPGQFDSGYPYITDRTRSSSDGDVNILALRIPCQYGKMSTASLFGNSQLTGSAAGGGGSGGSGSISAPAAPTVTSTGTDSTNETVSVSSSSGSGNSGAITFAQTTSNSAPSSSAFSSTTTYTQPRGSTRYYWASQSGYISDGTTFTASSVDTTPNAFDFTNQTGLEINTLTESNTVTITGITDAATVTISGNSAQFSIAGGSYGTSGTITNNQTLKLRMTTSSSFNTGVSTTITVGGVSDSVTFTTRAANVSAPTAITATQTTNTSSSSQTVDVTASGGTGTAQVSNDGSNFSSNGTDFSHSRNSTVTYHARNTNEGSNSSTITTDKFVPPVVTLSGIGNFTGMSASGFDNTYNVNTQRANGNYNTHSSHWGTTTVSISDNASWLTTQVTNTSTGTFRLAAGANTSGSRTATVTYTTSTSFGASHTMTFTVQQDSQDTTPDALSFAAQTAASGVTRTASDQVTGIDTSITVTYSGSGTGSFAIGSSLPSDSSFNQNAKTVSNGQFIFVRDTAPSTGGSSVTATVTAGGVSGSFVLTASSDSTPNAFSFTDVTNANTVTQFTDSVTITGINTSVTASISMGTDTGGGFRVNNSGSYSQTSKSVSNNDVVTVLVGTGSDSFTTYSATLTVGGVSDTFSVTTGSSGGFGEP